MRWILAAGLMVLFGCGSDALRYYSVSIGTRDVDQQVTAVNQCGAVYEGIKPGTGVFLPYVGNAYLPPTLLITATPGQLACYMANGKYDYINELD